MESVRFFLVGCAILLAVNGTPQVFHTPFVGNVNSTGRQYYAVDYLGSSPQRPPVQDYNLNHGEVDAPNEDNEENMENLSYNNGFVEIAHDEEIGSSMAPYDVNSAPNGESIPEEEEASPDDDDDDDEDDEDTEGEVVVDDNDYKGSSGVKVNQTISSEEESTTEEPLTEENPNQTIDLETYVNSTDLKTTTDMPDQITPAFVHPIHRPSSKWPLKATQLGNSKPKPSKKPIQKPLQDEQEPQKPHKNLLTKRRKPHKNYRKRVTVIRRRGNPKRRQNFGIPIRNANRKKPNGVFRRRTSSSSSSNVGSSSCGNCQCGVTTTRRIVGGQVAAVNELPWLALITYNDTIQCGGTLISDQLVLTAAHCVRGFDIELFQLQFFEYNTNSSMETVSVLRWISKMYSLKSYVAKTSEDDIAIIKLSRPIDFETTTVRPICLPTHIMDLTGDTGIIAGWGTTTEEDTSANIQTAEVPIISNQQCLLVGMKITNDMLCAGRLLDGGIDTCQGDSGGPLMIIKNKRYLLAGVISWGDGCARPMKPGIYTSITKYLPWIKRHTTGSCKCN